MRSKAKLLSRTAPIVEERRGLLFVSVRLASFKGSPSIGRCMAKWEIPRPIQSARFRAELDPANPDLVRIYFVHERSDDERENNRGEWLKFPKRNIADVVAVLEGLAKSPHVVPPAPRFGVTVDPKSPERPILFDTVGADNEWRLTPEETRLVASRLRSIP